ncbi:MAG TPA: hypothetical protein ENK41_02335 [Rhodobacteraceae bacterium]|nr:hypothetical protein [Paracoccaceae bacterium]
MRLRRQKTPVDTVVNLLIFIDRRRGNCNKLIGPQNRLAVAVSLPYEDSRFAKKTEPDPSDQTLSAIT